jgi:hypothetical protein
LAISSKIGQKKTFFWSKIFKFTRFLPPPTGNSTAARLLLHFYVTIFGKFWAKKPKKNF